MSFRKAQVTYQIYYLFYYLLAFKAPYVVLALPIQFKTMFFSNLLAVYEEYIELTAVI